MTKLSAHLSLSDGPVSKGELGDASDPTGDPTEWSFYG